MTKLAYYPGCSLHSTATEMDESFRSPARRSASSCAEIPGWECCGNTAAHSTNRLLAAALPANELAKVKDDMKLDAVAVPCAACFSRFTTAAHEIDDERAAGGRRRRGRRPPVHAAASPSWNMVDVYHDGVGVEALKAKVTKPFGGLKVACYYGCLLTRPPKVTLAEDPEYPTHMDAVVEALGCEPVEWGYKTDCCGASLALCEQDVVVALTRKILAERARQRRRGGRRRLPALPGQPRHAAGRHRKADPAWQRLPVLYVSQMVGRALGIDGARLGLKKHMVDVAAVMG